MGDEERFLELDDEGESPEDPRYLPGTSGEIPGRHFGKEVWRELLAMQPPVVVFRHDDRFDLRDAKTVGEFLEILEETEFHDVLPIDDPEKVAEDIALLVDLRKVKKRIVQAWMGGLVILVLAALRDSWGGPQVLALVLFGIGIIQVVRFFRLLRCRDALWPEDGPVPIR